MNAQYSRAFLKHMTSLWRCAFSIGFRLGNRCHLSQLERTKKSPFLKAVNDGDPPDMFSRTCSLQNIDRALFACDSGRSGCPLTPAYKQVHDNNRSCLEVKHMGSLG